MVGLSGLEPPTSRLSGVCSNQLSYKPILRLYGRFLTICPECDHNQVISGGDKRTRTVDPLLAKQVLYQLSYTPIKGYVYPMKTKGLQN